MAFGFGNKMGISGLSLKKNADHGHKMHGPDEMADDHTYDI